MALLRALQGDITQLDVDAIVNAANTSLLGGGGVDGAIHAAAGDALLHACRQLGGCATGDAKVTPGFKLKARWVIHAVGPVWRGGMYSEPQLLASCYHRAVQLAHELGAHSMALPCISTGVYQYPHVAAAEIAVHSVRQALQALRSNHTTNHATRQAVTPDAASASPTSLREVIFCCFQATDLREYERLLQAVWP